jgi:hypothetical protein
MNYELLLKMETLIACVQNLGPKDYERLLKEHPEYSSIQKVDGYPLIWYCTHSRNYRMVEYLVKKKKMDVNATFSDNKNVIYFAIVDNDIKGVDLLLKLKAKITDLSSLYNTNSNFISKVMKKLY